MNIEDIRSNRKECSISGTAPIFAGYIPPTVEMEETDLLVGDYNLQVIEHKAALRKGTVML